MLKGMEQFGVGTGSVDGRVSKINKNLKACLLVRAKTLPSAIRGAAIRLKKQ